MLSSTPSTVNGPARQIELQPILSKSSEIISQVLAQLVLKNAKRSVNSVVSKSSVKQALPLLARALDFVP